MIAPRAEVLATKAAEHGGRLALQSRDSGPSHALHDFSVCLNAFGPAEVVSRAIKESRIDEYPDPHSRAPRIAAAMRWDRPVAEIVFGAGAAELIHAVCFAYLRAGDLVVIATPAFGEYERAAALCGARVHSVDVLEGPTPMDRLAREIQRLRPRFVFLATPANPTGEALSLSDVRRIADVCGDADSLLVLDQAYDAFTIRPLGTPALPGHPSVLHIRSITKEHALAGVRVAFAIASADVADAIERVRVPWAASVAAQHAGVAAMTDDALSHVARTTALLRDEAVRLAAALQARSIAVRRSPTHFFLVGCASARPTRERLLNDAGILVRDCTSFGLPDWIRVAARTPAENDVLISALEAALP